MNRQDLERISTYNEETGILTFDFDKTDKQLDASEFRACLDEYRIGSKDLSFPSVEIRSSSPVCLSGDASYLFCNCRGNIVGCENLDVSGVTDMSFMFFNCLDDDFNPDVSNWDTSNVCDMRAMFEDCYGSSFNVDVSNWDTSSVTDMGYMFAGCHGDNFV